jgi:hypothetical protein
VICFATFSMNLGFSYHQKFDSLTTASQSDSTPLMSEASPLLAFALSLFAAEDGALDSAQEAAATKILADFIAGDISSLDATCQLSTVSKNSFIVINKLTDILAVCASPLPDIREHRLARDGHRRLSPWTSPEDNRLLAGIHKFGTENWLAVAKFVGQSRTRSQCSQRWKRCLDPQLKKSHWLPDEENKLIETVRELGPKSWTLVAGRMEGRSDAQCRYHFMQLQKESRKTSHNRPVAPSEKPVVTRPAAPPEAKSPCEDPHCTEFWSTGDPSVPRSTQFFSW